MRTVGQVLSEARNAKGISFAEAERATKIRAEILEALEADNFRELPGPTYLKGFIKNYADYLGLNSDMALAIFRRQFDERGVAPVAVLPDLSPKESPRLTITPGRVFGLGVSVLVLGFIGYLLAQYQSFAAAPIIHLSSPEDNLRITSGTVEVTGRTDRDATLRINGQEVALTESGAFSVSVALPDGTTELAFSAVNKLGRLTTIKRTVLVETAKSAEPIGPVATGATAPPPAEAPAVAAATAPTDEFELTIKVGPSNSWIEVTLDSQPVTFKQLFIAGSSPKTFKAKSSIKVLAGDAGSTEVIINGVSQGKLGQEKQVVTKTFTR